MRGYLDTEFTAFTAPSLMAIGIVLESGEEFYAECTDFCRDRCSDFVKDVVLKKLGRMPDRVFDRAGMQSALAAWLTMLVQRHGSVEIGTDFDLDRVLLVQVLEGAMPGGVTFIDVYEQRDDVLREQFFMHAMMEGRQDEDHHALYDARALRYACRPAQRA